MAALELRVDISSLIDAVISGNKESIISNARALLEQERNADVLIGRIGLIASKGYLRGPHHYHAGCGGNACALPACPSCSPGQRSTTQHSHVTTLRNVL